MIARRVALVTGASSGIGRATVRSLVEAGARVMATARREQLLAELAEETGVSYVAASLEDQGGCEKVVEETRRQLGPIEILVNDAAMGGAVDGSVLKCSYETWRRMITLNLDAPFLLTQLAAADMVSAGWGRIVMVSSTAGQVGGPDRAAYCSSKHGLLGLMRSAAVDLAPFGITSNAVLPGWVRTEMAERSAEKEASARGLTVEEIWDERAAGYPAGRILTPEQVAQAISFLSSEEASGISGEAVSVAGGSLW